MRYNIINNIMFLTFIITILFEVVVFSQDEGVLDIPYKKYVLNNGLTLIVHEDHKAPIVAVNIWYHVGSKNEKPGKNGLAHLCEHMMFNGSENAQGDFIKYMDSVGATMTNGMLYQDYVTYFQNVPTSALDTVLWLESDRMGHLLGVVNQEMLDEEREVVKNEKREDDNQPYYKIFELIAGNTYPARHPYSWREDGSMGDLDSISLEDARDFFRSYYVPSNAVISIAGDIEPETVKGKVEKYFADIPPGPSLDIQKTWIAKRSGMTQLITHDRVSQTRIYMFWNIPQWGDKQANQLNLLSRILAAGKNSRLYKRLVYDMRISDGVSSGTWLNEIGGQFYIAASAESGVSLLEIEQAINEELSVMIADGPTTKELEKEKTKYKTNLTTYMERIGGRGGKSDILAKGEVFCGDPGAYRKNLRDILGATPEDIKKAAADWLPDGVFILVIRPFPEYKATTEGADRSKVPEADAPPAARFPELRRKVLSNGLKVVLAERNGVPLVRLNLIFDAGYAADQFAQPGTASLAMNMLDEGTKTRTALQISGELELLGVRLNTGSNLDASFVTLTTLKENLDASLELMSDVVLNPSFSEEELDRQISMQISQIKGEKNSPMDIGYRVLPGLIFGKGHPYGNSLFGSGTEESVTSITREDLSAFHQSWFKPNNATMIVVGDTTLDEIVPKLEKIFGDWKAGDLPVKKVGGVEKRIEPAIFLVDLPDAKQSVVFAAQTLPPKAGRNENTIQLINGILGGNDISRVYKNIREDKQWSYGAYSQIAEAGGPRMLYVYAPVQADKTIDTIKEIRREILLFIGEKPATAEELDGIKKSSTLTLPGRWETGEAVLNSVAEIVQYGLPDDFYQGYADDIRAITLEQMHEVAENLLKPENLVWLVVGDRAKVEGPLKELGYGEVIPLDADGNVIK
jgi:zinc protease